MLHEPTVGAVAWIDHSSMPISSSFQVLRATGTAGWVAKTYVGLAATSNPPPPDPLPDFPAFRSLRQFRALMYCKCQIDVQDSTLRRFTVLAAVHDPGWTPPFDRGKYQATYLRFWDKNLSDPNFYAGEASPLSVVFTEAMHPNSTFGPLPSTESALVNGIIKYRAGTHTDDIGLKSVGCPYHVPWVWCEMLVTYGAGTIKFYGRASKFPSSAWYFQGKRVTQVMQAGDTSLAASSGVTTMNIYPVLSAGAPSTGPQSPLSLETELKGSIETHPYTVAAAPGLPAGGLLSTFPGY